MSEKRNHRIDYIEFSVTNMEKTKEFYFQALGWTFTGYAPGYVGIKGDHGEMGGFSLSEEVKPGGPLVVLYSNSLEESFNQVKKAGGEITKEIFSFPGGRRFEFRDPSGNQLAIWS